MEYRNLGSSGVKVSTLCLGAMTFGEADANSFMHNVSCDEPTAHAIMDRALEQGINFIDTADVYGQDGLSERVVGRWIAQRKTRDRIVLATKFRMGMGEGPNSRGGSRYRITRTVEESLTRLQTDRIDLYQTHKDDPDTPVEETLEALAKLVRAGKVRAIGASQYNPARLRESMEASKRLGIPRYDTLQPEYNLYDRAAFEKDLQPVALEHRLGVIPFFGLAKGFLSGKYRKAADIEGRPRAAGLKKYFEGDRGMRILGALDSVSRRTGATPAQVSLAWIMAQPTIAGPIVSVTSVAQLDEIAGAARLKLDREALAELDRASA